MNEIFVIRIKMSIQFLLTYQLINYHVNQYSRSLLVNILQFGFKKIVLKFRSCGRLEP